MFAVLSPAKKLNFEEKAPFSDHSDGRYNKKAMKLIKELRKCSEQDIAKLMKLSDSLAELNVNRYKAFKETHSEKNSKQAIFAFNGDTYAGFDVNTLKKSDINYAQNHVGILSGLYGLIRPLDYIQPYRLEMGTKFSVGNYKNLYDYWKETVTEEINSILKKEKTLVNCASNEYFSAVDKKSIAGRLITPVFKENKNGQLKVIGFSAKRARGMMARFIVENRVKEVEQLKSFNLGNYTYQKKLSSEDELVFTR